MISFSEYDVTFVIFVIIVVFVIMAGSVLLILRIITSRVILIYKTIGGTQNYAHVE